MIDNTWLQQNLSVVEIAGLLQYEMVDPTHVTEISCSLRASGILRNPVIRDKRTGLLIDGHHRVAALKQLGCTHAVAFDVDYLSREVQVRGIRRMISGVQQSTIHNLTVGVADRGQDQRLSSARVELGCCNSASVIKLWHFDDSIEASEHIAHLCKWLASQGASILLHIGDGNPTQFATDAFYVSHTPQVGKPDVLAAAHSRNYYRLPLTRHLVRNRVLGVCFPVEALYVDQRKASSLLQSMLGQVSSITPRDRLIEEDRLYMEPTVLIPRS